MSGTNDLPPQPTDQPTARAARLRALNTQLKDANQKLCEENKALAEACQNLSQASQVLSQASLLAEERHTANSAALSAKLAAVVSTALAAVNNDLRPPLQALAQIQGVLNNAKLADPKQDKTIRRAANRLKRTISSMTRALDRLAKLNDLEASRDSEAQCESKPSPDQAVSTATLHKSPQSKPRRTAPPLYLVDGDPLTSGATRDALESAGHAVEAFSSAAAFLNAYNPDDNGCILMDVLTLEIDGIELIGRLRTLRHRLPTIIVTSQGDAQLPLRAMREGAADFIEKPINPDVLLAAIQHIQDKSPSSDQVNDWQESAMTKIALLSARERQVLSFIVEGHPNKNIAADLGVSQRTIENHRASIMKKMGAKSLAQLVRLVLASERTKPPAAPAG
jgi:FixJ family two-component response regulator